MEQLGELERKGERRKYGFIGEDWGAAPSLNVSGEDTFTTVEEEEGQGQEGGANKSTEEQSTSTPCKGEEGGQTPERDTP